MIKLASDNFETVMSGLFLVDFSSESCLPCKMMKPAIEELESEYIGKISIGEVDVSENNQLAIDYKVTAVPTILIFKDGEVVKKLVGLQSKNELKKVIDAILGE